MRSTLASRPRRRAVYIGVFLALLLNLVMFLYVHALTASRDMAPRPLSVMIDGVGYIRTDHAGIHPARPGPHAPARAGHGSAATNRPSARHVTNHPRVPAHRVAPPLAPHPATPAKR